MRLKALLAWVFFAILASFVTKVASHGAMVKPINWFDEKGIGMMSGLQCLPGSEFPTEKVCPTLPHGCAMKHPGGACYWYKNNTGLVEPPTMFDKKYRTYGIDDIHSYYHHPWRFPGRSFIDSPCGVAGGNINGCVHGKCNLIQGGYGFGVKAENFKFPYKPHVTKWKRGDVVEVAWAIVANHGGGYSYRLCKVPEEGMSALTEECFQQTPLDFVGDIQWVQYGINESTRMSFPAIRLREGTHPKGSQWTKNPIPACKGNLGGFLSRTGDCPKGTQFPPPKPGLFGFGHNVYGTVGDLEFSIIDKVKIPEDLPAGDYVISFRWDVEQTFQVWNTCASVELL